MELDKRQELRRKLLDLALEASNDDFRVFYEGVRKHYLENGKISQKQLENVLRVVKYLF